MQDKFIHLRLHSEFSLSCGMVTVDKLIDRCKQQQQPAVAITDKSNLCALIKFYTKAIKSGIKPICGAEVLLHSTSGKQYSIILLCINNTGYKNLIELISQAYLENQKDGIPIIEKSWFSKYADGLIALSGGLNSDIGEAIISNNKILANQLLQQWMQLFPNRFYLELQRLNKEREETYIAGALELAVANDCPVVATNDVMFIEPDDFIPHEAKSCIYDGFLLEDNRRKRVFSEEQYLKSSTQMQQLFADIPEAIENTIEISKRCTINIELGKNVLPEYPIPQGETIDSFFRETCFDGLKSRMLSIKNHYEICEEDYHKRLYFELNVIIQMGFQGYFLIVMDFIGWAKQNNIPVGPGRGSGAGSLVAYCLYITDLDPLKYDLLFERFLNPERVSMPDFDIDFCMDKRDLVIDYVAQKYGRKAVSQIITFGTMAAKAVVRDIARVQGKSYSLGDRISKMIPAEIGMTLAKAVEQEESLREFLETDEEADEIWQMSLKLEGQTRNFGKHAGGVVIAPNKITDFSPLYCDEQGQGLVTQFDKNDVESAGLVKFDFLGLRTLTIIDWAVNAINNNKRANNLPEIDINKIDINDSKVFNELKKGETTGAFQLESSGMKDLIKKLLPDSLEDIIALVALFRPGPLQSGMVENFINRKHKREVISYPDSQYQHELLKPILEPTYGIILYQEQVMQIAQVLAGYTLGGADMLRRAMGKKKPEEMAKQRAVFRKGAIEQGIDPELAMKIFDLVEKFAGYGFNKSHSAAYGLISYQTLWLKTNYPAEFIAAVISSDMQNTDKVVYLIKTIHNMGIKLELPDINTSNYQFFACSDSEITFGLGAIKGFGEAAIETIVDNRNTHGKFKDLFDFCFRVGTSINKRSMEALIFSGALDVLIAEHQYNPALARAILEDNMPKALQAGIQEEQNNKSGSIDLFGGLQNSDSFKNSYIQNYNNIKPLDALHILTKEKDYMGTFFSGHPLDSYQNELNNFVNSKIDRLEPKRNQFIPGIITNIRINRNKRNEKIATIILSDQTGEIEATLFSKIFVEYQHMIEKDKIVIVEGEVYHDDYSNKLRIKVNAILDMTVARVRFAKKIQLYIEYEQITPNIKNDLLNIFKKNPGNMPVYIKITKDKISGTWEIGTEYQVDPTDNYLAAIKNLLSEDKISVIYT